MKKPNRKSDLELKIGELEAEIAKLRLQLPGSVTGQTVRVPEALRGPFNAAEETVRQFFADTRMDPTRANIEISGERYVLMRASSLSFDFLTTIKNLYSDYGEDKAFAIGSSFLFDISHVIGSEDAKNFHAKMGITDPIAKLSAGPVHFAYSGWAFVEISEESTPSQDENCFLKYDHPYSFEADSWIRAGRTSNYPVCIMNSGYSSGWCEESFSMPLTAVEVTCKAAGDDTCTFILAPPHKIEEHLARYTSTKKSRATSLPVPSFFERKRVEEEMQAARIKAEESDRMKSEFLANMSHEIRTPMNGVIGMIGLTLESKLTTDQRDYLLTARDSAESLLAIINQILDFSKIEAEGIVLDLQPFHLRTMVEETIKPFLWKAKFKNIVLSCSVADDVPDQLIGDEGRLRQIIVNLVGNAIKFTDKGNVDFNIAVDEKRSSDDQLPLRFSIRDTGIGIPEDRLESIFNAFTQVDMSTTRRFAGTGLGLTISRELVQLMNGRIWCENNTGAGSTFHFVVKMQPAPLVGSPEEPTGASGVNAIDTATPKPTRKLNILVAEDNRVNQVLIATILEKQGHSVTVTANGKEALECWRLPDNTFDLILMDILMPEMDGIDATRAIRLIESETGTHIPIIALTAQAMKGDREDCLNAGMDGYLSKPVRVDELYSAIAKASHDEPN